MTNLPYRFDVKSVYRYVPALAQLQDLETPRRLELDPSGIGVNSETAACRIRDAAHSLTKGLTTHPLINPTLLAERFKLYRVTHDGTKVFIVPRTEQLVDAATVTAAISETSTTLAVVEADDVKAILAFATLLSRRLLDGKVEIVGELLQPFMEQLETNYDVSLTLISPTQTFMF